MVCYLREIQLFVAINTPCFLSKRRNFIGQSKITYMYKKWSLSFDLNKIVSSFYYKTTLHYRETKIITFLQILLVSILFYKTRKRVDPKNKTRQEVSAKIHDNGKSTLLMFLIWIWITSSSVLLITTDIFHW